MDCTLLQKKAFDTNNILHCNSKLLVPTLSSSDEYNNNDYIDAKLEHCKNKILNFNIVV